MAGRKISELTETLTVDVEQDYVVIQRGTDNKKLKVANMMGSTNVGEDFVDLLGEDGTEYRLIIDQSGKAQVFPKDCVVGHKYAPGDNFKVPLRSERVVVGAMGLKSGAGEKNTTVVDVHGIVVNQAYGGGEAMTTDMAQGTSCSHSFVELYNCSDVNSVNLCGLYLHYKGFNKDGVVDGAWKTLALRGEIPPRCSFLIRGAQHAAMNSDTVNVKLFDYDQEWIDPETKKPIKFGSNGFSFYLCTDANAPTGSVQAYIEHKDATGTTITGYTYDQYYVDLLSAGPAGAATAPPAYNKFFLNCMDIDTGVRRINFRNNKNNAYDLQPINYRTAKNLLDVAPRSLRDGRWEQIEDKIKPNLNTANLINITLGKVPSTRLFTWQSAVTDRGAVKYRKIKDTDGTSKIDPWHEVESDREIVNNHSLFMTIHRVQIDNLEAGLYEYKCGEEGCWSDIEQMEVRAHDQNSTVKMLWTTDQQGFTELEYKAWETVVDAMRADDTMYDANGIPDFDFHLNTGDISQNASNLYEWLYYTKYAGEFCRNIPHMTTCGNNDLVEKKYGFAFNHYATYEGVPKFSELGGTVASKDAEMVSTYSFDIGHTHFICLNSNEEQMYNDYGIYKAQFLDKQARFLDKDLWQVSQRSVKPRWVVVYAHLSPFTVTRAKRLQHWIAVLEHYEVDLFICGHNHTYSRSIPIKCGYEKAEYSEAVSEKNYNTYVTTAATYTAVNETKKDNTTEIDRAANPAHGTYYVMFQAGAAKISGKEKAIDMASGVFTGIDSKHLSVNAPNRPWWYDYNGDLPAQPCYSTMNVTPDTLNLSMYVVNNVVSTNKETGIQTVRTYDEAKALSQAAGKEAVTKFDSLTINYSNRQPAYRTGGVSAPYYTENKN